MVICLEQGADFFACGPADATAIPKPHHLFPRLNPDWFYLSATGLFRLSWKRGRQTGLVVVIVVVLCLFREFWGLSVWR